MQKGLVHIYHGDGKGKTTCGVGLCVRAAGAGMKVLVFQFLKKNDSSERNILKSIPNVTVMNGLDSAKFVFQMTEQEKEAAREFYENAFQVICEKVAEEGYGLLFLDEVIHAVNYGMLPEERLIDFLKNRPEGLEVVMNGYRPSEALQEAADYISWIQKEKHPFDRGVPERLGIEK
ncbi:MAG: cob(I)yrinic acid a,c-diamide adenosyltransferase [Lachnospiraceae bacterium]|nr:cob(I)yrinic acid a,c-diamide adenosyltransferase [Lachnospiraceae bacterium]